MHRLCHTLYIVSMATGGDTGKLPEQPVSQLQTLFLRDSDGEARHCLAASITPLIAT